MKNIEEQYDKFKKYGLPSFKDLNNEFEIASIENENFLLREIISKVVDRTEFFSRLFEDLLQPDPSLLRSMQEAKIFNEEERKSIYAIYKKLMVINRKSVEVSLNRNEKEEANFINKTFDEWKELKTSISQIVDKIKDSWKKETYSKEKLSYLG